MSDPRTPYFIPKPIKGSAQGVKKMREEFNKAVSRSSASAQQDEREAFEAWYSEGGKYPNSVRRGPNGGYQLAQAHSAWEVWKARAAQQVQADARGEVVVTWDEGRTRILAVTRQDDDGQILSIIAEAPAQVQADAGAVAAVRKAIADYHYALDTRQHGSVAQDKAFSAIQRALGMEWRQGAEATKRAAMSREQSGENGGNAQ